MSEQKMDWMYKGVSGMVDPEAYLTGRKIDKTFELAQREERGERIDAPADDAVPTSLFGFPSSSMNKELSDLMREDPLFAIKKKQLEETRKILNNPLKMKKINELISKGSCGEPTKQKKHKKKHKRSKDDSSDDEKKHRHSKKYDPGDKRKHRNEKEDNSDYKSKHKKSKDYSPSDERKSKYSIDKSPSKAKKRNRHSKDDSSNDGSKTKHSRGISPIKSKHRYAKDDDSSDERKNKTKKSHRHKRSPSSSRKEYKSKSKHH